MISVSEENVFLTLRLKLVFLVARFSFSQQCFISYYEKKSYEPRKKFLRQEKIVLSLYQEKILLFQKTFSL